MLFAVITLVVLAAALAAVLLLAPSLGKPSNNLPSGCAKPAGGYLIIASKLGYNDSVDHGVPKNSWPVITVKQGQQVNIVVCNTDIQAHGFQVAHYYDSTIESIAPGQVIHVSFTASQTGNFRIYCSILCSVHAFMQSGLLVVTA